jgi:hypothetical protein
MGNPRMFELKYHWELPPIGLGEPGGVEDTIHQCARGESPPDMALMHLLIASCSEEETERVLGTAIWAALEDRNPGTAERLGAIQKLWDGAKDIVHSAVPGMGPVKLTR